MMMMMVAFDVVYWVRDPAPLLPLSCLVVLEPVEDVLALYLTVEAEVRGYVLDLISGWGPEPRSEQIRQYFNLFCGWIPTATTAFPSNSFHTNTWHSFVHIRPDPILPYALFPHLFFFSLVLFFVFSLCGSQTQIQTLLSEGSQTVEDPPSVYTSNTFTISYINYEGGYFGIRENEERCPLLPCGFFMLIVFCLLLLLINNTTESLSLFISQCLLWF